ncbi:MAG: LLM class flavin-dependent oxidoreductase [Streptosporangiaceae bacterium]|jgi:alkanesulfonate monooxygenase SsuD/methylene tetrahydromethanopterin reductase-like flavin-dependent oxidoreductase (luciferase family)
MGEEVLSRVSVVNDSFEPTTLLAALSTVTTHIGLVATASTTYNEPYHLARTFASLDHLSGGRAGWNLVTSLNDGEARNFGLAAHVGHADRYARAGEFFDVVAGLWDSFDDDAFARDQGSGVYFSPAGIHRLDHSGPHLRVAGPLNIARPRAGRSSCRPDSGRSYLSKVFSDDWMRRWGFLEDPLHGTRTVADALTLAGTGPGNGHRAPFVTVDGTATAAEALAASAPAAAAPVLVVTPRRRRPHGLSAAEVIDEAWRGQGLATRLIRAVGAGIRGRGEIPFLHAVATNPAIALYERLGFRHRRTAPFTAARIPETLTVRS